MSDEPHDPLANLQDRLASTEDTARPDAVAKRHDRGGRTARENLADLTEDASVFEYGTVGCRCATTAPRG